MFEEDYKPIYKFMPVISSTVQMTEYGIDIFDKKNQLNLSLRIYESEELEFDTPEYEYWLKHSDDEEDTPKIHVWVASKRGAHETEDKRIVETYHEYESTEFYRVESIYYPSEEYDKMFENIVNNHLGLLAPYTLLEFLDVFEE